jgi:hypothetical protein
LQQHELSTLVTSATAGMLESHENIEKKLPKSKKAITFKKGKSRG